MWQGLSQMGGTKVASHPDGNVRSLAISPDGRWLVSGSEDSTIFLYDLDEPEESMEPILLEGNEGPVFAAAISPDNWLFTGGWNGQINRWDLSSIEPSASFALLEADSGTIMALAISPDGKWLVSGSDDSHVLLVGYDRFV